MELRTALMNCGLLRRRGAPLAVLRQFRWENLFCARSDGARAVRIDASCYPLDGPICKAPSNTSFFFKLTHRFVVKEEMFLNNAYVIHTYTQANTPYC